MNKLGTFFRAIPVGIANMIPGVSGGTVAYMCGIYFPLLKALSTVTSRGTAKSAALFYLMVVGTGLGIGIVATSMLLSVIFETYVAEITIFFAGLVAGSIPWIMQKAHLDANVSPRYIALLCLSVLIVGAFSYYALKITSFETNIALSGWSLSIYILVVSFIAGIVMGIPGISGSFVLLITGVYDMLLTAVRMRDFFVIGLVCAGSIIAIILYAHSMLALLKQHEAAVQWGIAGAVIGSSLGLMIAYFSELSFFMLTMLFVLGCVGGWLFTLLGGKRTAEHN